MTVFNGTVMVTYHKNFLSPSGAEIRVEAFSLPLSSVR
jgi:hypothetical protein